MVSPFYESVYGSDAMLPDFMIIGAAKCGTTSIASVLSRIPGVFVSKEKEPKFFSRPYRPQQFAGPTDEESYKLKPKTLEEYKALFSNSKPEDIKGEASTDYLFFSECAKDILACCGDIKIIVILRNPPDRAYSNYDHMVRDGRETLSFEEALKEESKRKNEGYEYAWLYFENGLYAERLKYFIETFSQVKVFIFEDFFRDPVSHYNELLEFIGSPERLTPESEAADVRKNVSGIPKFRSLYRFATSPAVKALLQLPMQVGFIDRLIRQWQVKMLTRRSLSPDTRDRLKSLYSEDIVKLERVLGQSLAVWR